LVLVLAAQLRLAADLRLAHEKRYPVLHFRLARQQLECLPGGRPL
jgi:hypothetical protein